MENMKTIHDLRNVLADEISKLRNGDTTPAHVNAVTNATGKILSTVKLEIEYNKLIGNTPHIDFIDNVDNKSKKQLTKQNK